MYTQLDLINDVPFFLSFLFLYEYIVIGICNPFLLKLYANIHLLSFIGDLILKENYLYSVLKPLLSSLKLWVTLGSEGQNMPFFNIYRQFVNAHPFA